MEPLGNGAVASVLSAFYGAAVGARNAAFDAFPYLSKLTGRPTISIGGIHAGGTGKTPLALLVGRYALSRGYEPAFLSRGYRRKSTGAVISAPGTFDTWETVGDEPALLHAALPQSWLGIGRNRLHCAKRLSPLLSKKAVFVLDDAFQHRHLKRDLDIACLPPGALNERLLPSGMLREPLKGLSRARCLCLIGTADDTAVLEDMKRALTARFPKAEIVVMDQAPAGWVRLKTGEYRDTLPLIRPAALCGIARPWRFIFLLKKLGISLSAQSIFNDHHVFKNHEIESIANGPGVSGIVTTEKDAFRLQSLKLVSWPDIWYLKIELVFSDERSHQLFNRIIDTVLP